MAKTASLNIRIDPETKAGAEMLFGSFGITVTDAINMFLRQSLMLGGLPFELKRPKYNAETLAAIEEARGIAAGKIKTKSYDSVAALMEDLHCDTED
ncbi:MAG: type II toxin-antitoxin system RelB/DinJ family antitoxin [Clostridia bacterium]|nr:type II toxin-antitoxin system RelB/DinJ family antitoxin [Clostridia bacterium]